MNDESENMPRDFKGLWIPKEIWNRPNLLLIEKTLLSQFEKNGDIFICPNISFLENFFGLRKNIILKHIKRLKAFGLEIKLSNIKQQKKGS